MNPGDYSRGRLIQEASLTEQDLAEIAKCRRDYNRLGFAYQIGYVRLFNRFPLQQPFEIHDELLSYTAMQLGIDEESLTEYANRQHTVSAHQAHIREYLARRNLGPVETRVLEEFVFEESCRLEQTSSLLSRAREFLKERGVLCPADSTLGRIIMEQRKRARTHIFGKIAEAICDDVSRKLAELLEVGAGRDALRVTADQGESEQTLC